MHRIATYVLVFAVSLLAATGIVMLTSTSYHLMEKGAQEYSKVEHQSVMLVVGAIVALGMALLHHRWLYQLRWWILGASLIGLALCYIPFFADEVNGASRWISLHSFGLPRPTFQPSELAKLAIAISLAGWFSRHEPATKEFCSGFLYPGFMVAVTLLLIAGEVDLGTAALVGAVGGSMMFAAGTRLWYLVPVATVAIAGFAIVVRTMPNRVERILAYLDLEKYKDGLGLQQWRALIALGSGAIEGVGNGYGKQKRGFLPESVTDFIFPNIGEEFGLYGTCFVLILFVLVLLAGMSIAMHATDRFSRLLAFGITITLALEAIINMGVTTALLPNKGLPLPFVSYGGTNLIFAMASIGILVNIHRHSPRPQKKLLLDTRRGGMRPGKLIVES
jgi:cell division protein FtsW